MVFSGPYTTAMDGQCTGKHLAALKRRYNDDRLREAARRREHLDCQRIARGAATGSGRVKLLLAQMHQAYYFGFSETACILAGTVLEQALIRRLGAELDLRGPLSFVRSGHRKWLATRQDLLDLELVDMLELAKTEGILRSGKVLLLAHEIRWIRNSVVHEAIPLFHPSGNAHLELTVAKSRKGRPRHAILRLDQAEVDGLPAAVPGGLVVRQERGGRRPRRSSPRTTASAARG